MQILFVRLFKKILRANNSKLKTEGSNAQILQLRFLAAYTEYKPTLAPISQSTDSEGIAFIHSSVSGSLLENVSYRHLHKALGAANLNEMSSCETTTHRSIAELMIKVSKCWPIRVALEKLTMDRMAVFIIFLINFFMFITLEFH